MMRTFLSALALLAWLSITLVIAQSKIVGLGGRATRMRV